MATSNDIESSLSIAPLWPLHTFETKYNTMFNAWTVAIRTSAGENRKEYVWTYAITESRLDSGVMPPLDQLDEIRSELHRRMSRELGGMGMRRS